MRGFKSFADKIEIEINSGITELSDRMEGEKQYRGCNPVGFRRAER